MHFRSVELSDVKVSAIPPSKYEAWFSLIFYFVKQLEPINESRSFISFTQTLFGICLMQLAILFAYLL